MSKLAVALFKSKKLMLFMLPVLLILALLGWWRYNPGPLKLKHLPRSVKEAPVFLDEMNFPGRYPVGLALNDHTLYMTFFHEEEINTYSVGGREKSSFPAKTRGAKGFPHSLAFLGDKLVVTDTVNGVIGFFNGKGKALDAFWETPDKQKLKPVGIAVYKNIFYITDANLKAWLAIDKKGELINIVRGNTPESTLYFPWGIAISSDGRAFIADYKGSRVKVFNCAGWYIHDFETGLGREILNSPQGVAVDGLGRVHVTDKVGNKIFVFDNYGKFLFTYGKGLNGPGAVAVDTQARIVYIANTEGQTLQVWGY